MGGVTIAHGTRPRPGDDERLAFIEEVGLAFEAQGLPRMAGRILGALLVADPPEQSAEELAGTLRASRGSMSTMTRMLEQIGLIDRVSKPGERRIYYRNSPDAWHQRMRESIDPIRTMRELADKGLRLMRGAPDDVLRGLIDMRRFYAYWETAMPAVLAAWHEASERGELPPAFPPEEGAP